MHLSIGYWMLGIYVLKCVLECVIMCIKMFKGSSELGVDDP